MIDASILICTRNRAGSLARVLESLCCLAVPSSVTWEVIVVDNASTDETAATVASFAARLPIRHALETAPGLSHARNRGVEEARGRLLCWTDDDVLVDADWMASYLTAAARRPEAALFGGRVTPVLEPPTPGWFVQARNHPHVAALMAERQLGVQEIPLSVDGNILPYGANFAIVAEAQQRHRYDPRLGVSSTHSRSGEETQVFVALLESGASGWWVPASNVRHIIPANRQSWRYFKEYHAAQGETWALLAENPAQTNFISAGTPTGTMVLGAPAWMWRLTVSSRIRGIAAQAFGQLLARVENERLAAFYGGAIRYLHRR